MKKNVSRSVMTNWRKKYHKHETNLEFQWSKNALVAFGEFIVTYVKYIHPNGNFKNMLQTFFRSTKWCHGEMDRNAFSHENRNSRPKWKHGPSKPSNVKGMISVRRFQFSYLNKLWTVFFSLDHFMQLHYDCWPPGWLMVRSFPKGIRFCPFALVGRHLSCLIDVLT